MGQQQLTLPHRRGPPPASIKILPPKSCSACTGVSWRGSTQRMTWLASRRRPRWRRETPTSPERRLLCVVEVHLLMMAAGILIMSPYNILSCVGSHTLPALLREFPDPAAMDHRAVQGSHGTAGDRVAAAATVTDRRTDVTCRDPCPLSLRWRSGPPMPKRMPQCRRGCGARRMFAARGSVVAELPQSSSAPSLRERSLSRSRSRFRSRSHSGERRDAPFVFRLQQRYRSSFGG